MERMIRVEMRPIARPDLDQVLAIHAEVYPPGLQENPATFEDKLSLRPVGAFGVFLDKFLCGYVIAHPWSADRAVPLGLVRTLLPEKPDCLYIHDLAVRPSFRGRGIARLLVDRVFEFGNSLSLRTCALMAVQSSESFWSSFGFMTLERVEYVPGIMGTRMIRHAGKQHGCTAPFSSSIS